MTEERAFVISHPEKPMFPDEGITTWIDAARTGVAWRSAAVSEGQVPMVEPADAAVNADGGALSGEKSSGCSCSLENRALHGASMCGAALLALCMAGLRRVGARTMPARLGPRRTVEVNARLTS
jgi:hypothetical protein